MASQDTTYVTRTTPITTGQMQTLNDLAWKGRNPIYATTTGSGVAYVLTLPSTSLYNTVVAGDRFSIKIHTTNTGSATLTIVGATTLAAKTIVNAAGSNLIAGQLLSGQVIDLVYDGTNFQAINLTSAATTVTAANVSFTQTGTGTVATTVQVREQQRVSLWDFLTSAQITDATSGSPTLDLTTAINQANSTAVATKRTLYWPNGTYLATQITALTGMTWVGESMLNTVLKLKSGTNPVEGSGALVYSPTLNVDDVWIQNMTFDGNSSGNTQGNTLVLNGAHPVLKDVTVINSASNAISTDWNGPSFRSTGFEGYFEHIVIDSPQKSGWLHRGPSDCHFNGIMIIDAGIKTNNSYYGMYLDAAGTGSNGRFNNFHHWNRSTTTNVAITGMYVGFGGNTFTNCHFEGGMVALNVATSLNTFESCDYYAPRGSYAITMNGATNKLSGIVGATYFTGNRNYTGLNLAGGDNMIDLVVIDQVNAINFADSATGGNFVTVSGYLNAPGTAYTGTYSATDVINIYIQGITSGTLAQGIANSNFYAYQSSAQSLTASAYNVISCPNLLFDTNNEYNTGTSRWTCKVAGVYQFTASMFFTSATANIKAVAIHKNGSLAVSLQYLASTQQAQLSGTTPPIQCAVGDYIEARYYSGLADTAIPGQAYVYFGGCRIK